MSNARRRFVTQIGAAVAAVGGGAMLARAQAPTHAHPPGRMTHDTDYDEWMKKLTGHHRQFFHAVTANELPGLMAGNYLDAYTGPYGMRADHVNAAIGVHGPALSLALNDAMWKKFEFGKKFSISDPTTSQPAERNLYAAGSDIGISELQQRGVVLVVCGTAMRLSSARWAASVSQTPEETHAELRANVLPGAVIVPALVVAMNRAQEAGFTYVRAS